MAGTVSTAATTRKIITRKIQSKMVEIVVTIVLLLLFCFALYFAVISG